MLAVFGRVYTIPCDGFRDAFGVMRLLVEKRNNSGKALDGGMYRYLWKWSDSS